MASIKERKDKDGKLHYHVQIRIKGLKLLDKTYTILYKSI